MGTEPADSQVYSCAVAAQQTPYRYKSDVLTLLLYTDSYYEKTIAVRYYISELHVRYRPAIRPFQSQ